MNDVTSILKRAAETSGFSRVRYTEKNIPTSISNVCVLPFFGDFRSTFILSSMLLNRYREQCKSSKYFILLGWTGFESLFPYVDEYWEIKNSNGLSRIHEKAIGFNNFSDDFIFHIRSLNYFFEDVIKPEVFSKFYENGIKDEFFNSFKHVKRFLPNIISGSMVGQQVLSQFNNFPGLKVAICPTVNCYHWVQGKLRVKKIEKIFWVNLCEFLLQNGLSPVILQSSWHTYDLSTNLAGKCFIIQDRDMNINLSIIRMCNCFLDIFNGTSKFSIAARSPYFVCDERIKYASVKDVEIDCLCGHKIKNEYFYTFLGLITDGDKRDWELNFFNPLAIKLKKFILSLDRDSLLSTVELNEIVPYSNVQLIKNKKFGTRFVKIKKD